MPRRKKAPEAVPPPARPEAEVDREIAEDFQERQNMSEEGRDELARKLRNHNSLSPELSAGDVDAAWETARVSGEETFTGHAPTPDQDQVDEMGAAAGLTYKDDEPLQYGKVARRDERRWELDPRSGQAEQAMEETDDDDEEDDDDAADADDAPLRFWDLADDLDAEVEEEDEDEEDDDEDEDDEAEEDEDITLLAEDEDELSVAVEAAEDDELDSDLDEDLEDDEVDEDLDDLDDLDEEDDDDED